MHSSLFRAGRTTHLKIVLVSLAAVFVVVAVGFNARTTRIETTGAGSGPAVVKAKQAPAYAGTERATVR